MINTPYTKAQKIFNLVEVYIQQRDGKGANKGEKIYLFKGKYPFVSSSFQEEITSTQLPVIQSIMIHEDMKAPSLKGRLNFVDRLNIVESLKLSPLDLLYIKVMEEETYLPGISSPKIKNLVFSITSVAQLTQEIHASTIGPNTHTREVQLEFCSNEHYILNYSYFDYMDEDFIGPISGKNGLIQYISDKVFKKNGTPFSTASVDIKADETSNYIYLKKYHNFYPWGKPTFPPLLSSLMQMLTEHSVDKNNPNAANFMFWQDLDGWNFRSVESIIKEYPEPVAVYKVTTNTDDPTRILAFEFNIEGDVETDFFQLIKHGAFGSNYLFVEPKYEQDPYARFLDTSDSHEIKQINYEYIKDNDKWLKIEQLSVLDDSEYVPNWNKNRQYDQFYGYFNSGFYNKKKKVDWEYHGYSYSNRQEDTLWQTVFDITDMDGEILRKIQKEIKEPLVKHRKEYAKKMNLKEKWKVYRCSICCAGLMDDDMGSTLSNALSSYEIVAAGSFTDVLNYDGATKVQGSTDPFQRSGITLSYDLNEYPYSLSLGEFFNLEQQPDVFTKYRFDLEITRYNKLLDILNKNIQARENRKEQYNSSYAAYQAKWNVKKTVCEDSSCIGKECTCPSTSPSEIKDKVDSIIAYEESLKRHEQEILDLPSTVSIQSTIEKLEQLKQEFELLYESYWNRRAFFFSKDIDYSFLKSGNNLFNIKSIKRMRIKGSKYEKFATRKAFSGYTLDNGLTSTYEYTVPKELCGEGETANPYYDRKYKNTVKADKWDSFENPLSKFPYTENNDIGKGPIWYRNWKIKYTLLYQTDYCLNSPVSDCCNGLVPVCVCTCSGPLTQSCNPSPGAFGGTPPCSTLGEEGVDYYFGECDQINTVPWYEDCVNRNYGACVTITSDGTPDCGAYAFSNIAEECCEGDTVRFFDNISSACEFVIGDGPGFGGCFPTDLAPQVLGCDQGNNNFVNGDNDQGGVAGTQDSQSSTCEYNQTTSSSYNVELEMYAESFSNDFNSNVLTFPVEIRYHILAKLKDKCNEDKMCRGVEITDITPVDSEPKLLHPWAADELTPGFDNDDYIDYKKSSSLFVDDLSELKAPSLNLEEMESYVRVEFKSPIGLESLKDFPEGFINTPGSEYFMPYIVLLTAGPFGTESAKANVSVIGQDPYGFDVAVKKTKNRDDFAKMNLHDYGADPVYQTNSCNVFSTATSWLRHAQNLIFYKSNNSLGDIFTPMGIQDIFAASSLQRSVPVKTWWDLWVSLPPIAMSTFYNRINVNDTDRGRVPFYEEGSLISQPKTVDPYQNDPAVFEVGWPFFAMPDTENIAAGAYPGNAAITPNDVSQNSLSTGEFIQKLSPTQNNSLEGDPTIKDPSNVNYYFSEIVDIRNINPTKQYPVVSYPVGTMIYGGAGFTVGQVWKHDSSRLTEYGMVQLSSDSMPSIISLVGNIGGNVEDIQKYYNWVSDKVIDWYQNTIFDNNFSAQFVVFSKQTSGGCKDYPCSNPDGFIDNTNCPTSDPLCNCPCQELRPDKIVKVKDRFTGQMIPALTADFGPEPSSLELAELKEKTKECTLIKRVLGEEWLGCVWEDPTSPYNCSCPCIGTRFYDYMKYNRTQSTFWSTPLETPLYRNAQMVLLMSNKLKITVPGDLAIKSGQIIEIDGTVGEIKKRYNGKWLVMEIEHLMGTSSHVMNLILVRDSNSNTNS